MAWAYSLTLPTAKLVALLQTLEPNVAQAILEWNLGLSIFESLTEKPRIRFVSIARPPDEFHFNNDFDPQQWERGRTFGEQMELRWRRRDNEFAVLLITETPLTLPDEVQAEMGELPEPTALERCDGDEPLKMILWGEWQDPKAEPELPDPARHWWYEERIPQFLGYPWGSSDSHLAIEVARYCESNTADSEPFPGDFVYRFVRLLPVAITPVAAVQEEELDVIEEEEEDD
jgi:hypothetical protein